MERTEISETMESTTVSQTQKSRDVTKKSAKIPKMKITNRKNTKSALELRRARILKLGPPQILMSPESLIIPEGDAIRLKYKVSGVYQC